LRAAGALILGSTPMTEYGLSPLGGNPNRDMPRNAHDEGRLPGGSSSGSGVAVAAGVVPVALGADGGGSIRIPACYTGAFGLKPTFGRVSRAPLMMRDWIDTTCYGPLTRDVTDAALFLDAVVGPDARDPDTLPHPGRSYVDALDDLPRGLRIAYSATLGYARVEPDVRREVEAAVEVLARALDRPVERLVDRFTDAGFAWAGLNAFELHGKLADLIEPHRGDWGRGFLLGLDLGARLTAADVGRFQRERLVLIDEVAALFERYDLLLTPTLPTAAFPAKGPLPETIDGERLASPIHAVAFTYPFNLTGHPAATVRAGFSDERLPVGLQLVAARGREDLLLQVARAYERVRPFDAWPREPRGQAPS
jgi:aspartyl-tRNA(Asn)/glutamyl-tRNA(Gln) amidotransferase subunit A